MSLTKFMKNPPEPSKANNEKVRVISYKNSVPKGYEEINTTSRAEGWSQGLSPFVLGPVKLYDGYVAKNVENAWQFAKVYEEYTDDEDGNPNDDYWDWAKEGWSDSYAHRHPMGKGLSPEYLWWDGKKYTYIEARKIVYVRLYARAVQRSSAFSRLLKKIKSGTKVALRDFDGYDHKLEELTYNDVINDPSRKMGHAFVLAMVLDNILEKEE